METITKMRPRLHLDFASTYSAEILKNGEKLRAQKASDATPSRGGNALAPFSVDSCAPGECESLRKT